MAVPHPPVQWDNFERSLISFLRHGVRGRALLLGFVAPALALLAASSILQWNLNWSPLQAVAASGAPLQWSRAVRRRGKE